MNSLVPTVFAASLPSSGGWGEGNIDLIVVITYLVCIVSIGCWAGLRKKRTKGSDYFLAGRSLTWPLIGLALFATNISTVHLVSLAESGYTSGLLYGNFEWMAGFTLIILALFFAPFYIRANVTTLPDFLEKRYNRGCRDFLAILSIFSAIAVHIGFALYTGAVVFEGSLLGAFIDNPEDYRVLTIIALCGAAALYTIIGGLTAVVVTESIETVVLLIGATCITIFGLYYIGGWSELKAAVHPVNFSMCRAASEPTGITWFAVFLGYPVLGIWYWCTDQTIVQRVLGAKDENHARLGPLFASFIKILPVFIFVLPGLVCLGLINKEIIPALPLTDGGAPDANKTYTHMIAHVLPVGFRGVVLAALLAALMSTLSGAMNSIGTLFSYDIYKRWKPDADDRHLIRVGRIATFGAVMVAILWSLAIAGLGKTIFQAMVDIFPAVAPPTAVVFVWGVFWKRASGKAALITLITGFALGLVVATLSLMGKNQIGDYEINSLLAAAILFVAESLLLAVLSYIFPHTHTAQSEALVWKSPLEALRGETGHWLFNYRLWVAGVLTVMVGLYIYWAGEQSYYPIDGVVTLNGRPVVGAEVSFDCGKNKPLMNFRKITNNQGDFAWGTTRQAGGAPAGTVYRVAITPKKQLIVAMKDETREIDGKKQTERVVDKLLYEVPLDTKIERQPVSAVPAAERGNGKYEGIAEVLTFRMKTTDSKEEKGKELTVFLPWNENVEILKPSDIPEVYTHVETSPLEFTVEKGKNHCNIELKSATAPSSE